MRPSESMNQACHEGFTCQFIGLNLFVEQAALNRAAGTFLRFRDRMLRADILVLDDFGLKKFNATVTQDFYDILEERYQEKSTIVTSQLPISNWKEVIEDEVALEAILDRLVYGLRLEITGESYRKKRNFLTGEDGTE